MNAKILLFFTFIFPFPSKTKIHHRVRQFFYHFYLQPSTQIIKTNNESQCLVKSKNVTQRAGRAINISEESDTIRISQEVKLPVERLQLERKYRRPTRKHVTTKPQGTHNWTKSHVKVQKTLLKTVVCLRTEESVCTTTSSAVLVPETDCMSPSGCGTKPGLFGYKATTFRTDWTAGKARKHTRRSRRKHNHMTKRLIYTHQEKRSLWRTETLAATPIVNAANQQVVAPFLHILVFLFLQRREEMIFLNLCLNSASPPAQKDSRTSLWM